MDTNEINCLLRKYKAFTGTFPFNHLPIVSHRPAAVVANLDDCKNRGSHWVAIYLSDDGTGEYFDSFGLPPLLLQLQHYMDLSCPLGYTINPTTLQSFSSITCGMYCVLYLRLRLEGHPAFAFYSLFPNVPLENDRIVKTMFGN